MTDLSFKKHAEVLKVNEELGLVLGWAIVCTVDGKPYFDKQDDHIPENAMLKAATDFMLHSRRAKEMHDRDEAGTVIYAFPLTSDIQKAYGIECDRTGLMIIMKPDEEMLEKFKSGELTGFSIGGRREEDEAVEE